MNEKKAYNLSDNPIEQFNSWLKQASETEINDPGAMALATSTIDGKPSVRIVLLKKADDKGFKFHTNAESQKGEEMKHNPHASLCFYWKSLRKQVRADGIIEVISDTEADEYFASRPYNRQIGAWASNQSRTLDSRATLEERIAEFEAKYPKGSVPRPSNWVGYRLVPERIEFWMDNPDRLHDRFIYSRKDGGKWDIERLYP